MARTAVVAGTATAVSNRVSRRQADRWAGQDAQQAYDYQQAPPPPPPQYQQAPPSYQQQAPPSYQQAPPAYEPPPPPPPPPPAPTPVVVLQQPAAPDTAPTDTNAKLAQLQQLGDLKAQGILTEAEFEEQKRRILAS
jgi:hypothetical protein